MTNKCLGIVDWLKSWFYDKTTVDNKLGNKQDSLVWEQVYTSSDINVYSNGQMVEVKFDKQSITASAWGVISTGTVPSEYCPHTDTRIFFNNASTNTATMYLSGSDGKIRTLNAVTNLNGWGSFIYPKR